VTICRQQLTATERLTTLRRRMTLRRHKHTAITIHAIRQRAGVPYHVERKICSNCQRLLEEKTIKRAAA
jgi:RNase P subunit RPR2